MLNNPDGLKPAEPRAGDGRLQGAIVDAAGAAQAEALAAMAKHGAYRSAHEAYGVLLEEVDEFWEIVRQKRSERDPAKMRAELVQVAAVALKAIVCLAKPVPSDAPARSPLGEKLERRLWDLSDAFVADAEGHTPTPHEPVKGVTLWNNAGSTDYPSIRLAGDGRSIGYLRDDGSIGEGGAESYTRPNTSDRVLKHCDALRAFRDRVRPQCDAPARGDPAHPCEGVELRSFWHDWPEGAYVIVDGEPAAFINGEGGEWALGHGDTRDWVMHRSPLVTYPRPWTRERLERIRDRVRAQRDAAKPARAESRDVTDSATNGPREPIPQNATCSPVPPKPTATMGPLNAYPTADRRRSASTVRLSSGLTLPLGTLLIHDNGEIARLELSPGGASAYRMKSGRGWGDLWYVHHLGGGWRLASIAEVAASDIRLIDMPDSMRDAVAKARAAKPAALPATTVINASLSLTLDSSGRDVLARLWQGNGDSVVLNRAEAALLWPLLKTFAE